jgi:hypothetical protein
MVALGTVSDCKNAEKLAMLFGTGNILVYARSDAANSTPQFIGIGVTTGCEVIDGTCLRGTWDLVDNFGKANPFTKSAFDFMNTQSLFYDMMCWDIPPRKALSLTVRRKVFAKVYMTDVVQNMRELAREGARAYIARKPEIGRVAVLMKLFFTFSDGTAGCFSSLGLHMVD